MTSIVDERGFNQGYWPTQAQRLRLRRRASAIATEMRRSSPPAGWDSVHVLEIGCGTGELSFELHKLTGVRITGVDLSRKFIAQARASYQHPRLEFKVIDLMGPLPELESSSYNYIVGNGILHHLYGQLDRFLPKLKRGLCPNGKLIFWEPNLFNPYIFSIFSIPFLRRLAHLEPSEMAFTPRFIKQRLRQAGFNDVRAVPRDFLLPQTPASWIESVVKIGDRVERCYGVRAFAQSIFLSATNQSTTA